MNHGKTDQHLGELIAYEQFLKGQDRRRQIAADLRDRENPPMSPPLVAPAPAPAKTEPAAPVT